MTIEYLRNNNLIILECISGSRAYNLNVPTSDTDIKGVFFMPKDRFYGLHYIPQVANESNDIVFYEIGRFIELLAKNNPNILELLATPEDKIIHKHPLFDRIKSEHFLSKKCKDTFGGYAFTQVKRARGLNKKIVNPVDKKKKTVLDFCYILKDQGSIALKKWLKEEDKIQDKIGLVNIPHFHDTYGVYYDDTGLLGYKGVIKKDTNTSVLLSAVKKGDLPLTYLQFNQNGYIKYCKDYKEYWSWVKNRNAARYDNNIQHGKNYDSKNMMHTFRLLDMAIEILRDQKILVSRPNREELLSIRNGDWSYDDLIDKANAKMEEVEKAFEMSTLPDDVDNTFVESLLIDIRTELYQ